MTLTDRQIGLVRESFAQIQPIAGLAAELFYTRLFAIAPHTQHLFHGDMADQGKKLMSTLGVVVKGLDNLEALLPVAEDLAARHVTYGVTPSDYEPVGQALIWTLDRGLDGGFTEEHRKAWASAYTLLSTAMVRSAYPLADPASEVAAQ
ncbi:MAG: globin family protein [Pseudomonadota bacterium]